MTARPTAGMDGAITRRSRALLYAARISHIEDARLRSQDEQLAPYHATELCLHAIDAVAVRMDLESGATWEQARDEVAEQAARQHPDGAEKQHQHVAEWLLRQLTDDEDAHWLDMSSDGDAVVRSHRVYMLYETEQAGLHHLRARDQAINVLVDALDLDIDSAQLAAEARFEHLVRRGSHELAYRAANDSRMLSIRFMEQVRDDLSEATRDLRTEHWASTVSPRLSAALTHIIERVERERRLKELVDHAIDRADAADFQWIPRTLELLDECLTRHQALQQVIAVARDTFLIEQQRQHLTPRSLRAFPHPVNEVLMGALARPCRDCDIVVDACERALGARAPRLLSVWAGLEVLAQEPAAVAEHGRDVIEPHLVADREPLLFTAGQIAWARAQLDSVTDAPVGLAALAERSDDLAARHALVLLALAHRSPELALLHGQGARDTLLAYADGDAHHPTSPALTLERVALADPDRVLERASR